MDKLEAIEILLTMAQHEEEYDPDPGIIEALKMGAQSLQKELNLYGWVEGDLKDWLES